MVDLENQTKISKVLDASIMLMEGNTLDDTVAFINDGSQGKKRNRVALIGKYRGLRSPQLEISVI